jgi:hypothetical protein
MGNRIYASDFQGFCNFYPFFFFVKLLHIILNIFKCSF